MRMYVQLDVEWPGNRKRLRVGLEASAIHAITLCLAKRSDRDGWVAREELALYGGTDELVERLLHERLLDEEGEWVRPHDWLEENASSERIRLEKSEKARAANHARWQHDGAFESCPICQKSRSSEPDPVGVQSDSEGDPPTSLAVTGTATEQQPQATDPDSRRAALEAAAAIIGERAGARPSANDPAAVSRAVARGVIRDRYQDAYRLLAADPAMTPLELADLLEPPELAKPLVVDRQSEASRVLAERNRLRLIGEACATCGGEGWYLDDQNEALRCDCRSEVSA